MLLVGTGSVEFFASSMTENRKQNLPYINPCPATQNNGMLSHRCMLLWNVCILQII